MKLIGLFLVPAATVCVNLSSRHISSPEQPISEVGALTGQNLLPLILGGGVGNNQIGGKHSRPTAWAGGDGVGYGDAGGGILHIAELSKCAQCRT